MADLTITILDDASKITLQAAKRATDGAAAVEAGLDQVIAAGDAQVALIDAAAALALGSLPAYYPDLATALASAPSGARAVVQQPSALYEDTYTKTSGALVLSKTDAISVAGTDLEAQKVLENSPMFTAWPVAPIIEIAPIDAKAFGNLAIPNRRGATPTRDLLQYPKIVPYGSTVAPTTGRADPWGGTTASLLTVPDNSNVYTLLTVGTGEDGIYKFAFEARSKAGLGARAFALSTGFSGGTAYPTMEGAWATIEQTFALTAGQSVNLIYSSTAFQIDVTPLRITPPEVRAPSPSVPIVGGLTRPGIMKSPLILGTGDTFNAAVDGRVKFTADGSLKSFSEMTMLIPILQTATSPTQCDVFYSDPASFGSSSILSLGVENDKYHGVMPGLNAAVDYIEPYTGPRPLDLGWAIVALRFNATQSNIILNGITMATGTGTGGTPYQIASAVYGGASVGIGLGSFNGFMGRGVIFDRFLSDAQIALADKRLRQLLTFYGDTIDNNAWFEDGDSIQVGADETTRGRPGWVQLIGAALKLPFYDVAVSGSTMDHVTARLPALVAKIRLAKSMGRNVIVSLGIGINGIKPLADTTAWINAVRAAGADKIVGVGIVGNKTTALDTYIAGYKALAWDAYIDFSADSRLYGTSIAPGTNFADSLHPNGAGAAIMATIAQPVIAALRA